jgi:hypothetical protein
MNANTNTFRPTLESLESREVPAYLVGYNTPGMYHIGSEQVAIFATEFRGPLTTTNAGNAFWAAERVAVNNNICLDPGAVVVRHDTHANNWHLVIGWYNLNEHVGGWIAGNYSTTYNTLTTSGPWYNQYTSIQTHTTMDWLRNDGWHGYNQEGWESGSWTTDHNNYRITLSMVPNTSGNVEAHFSGPTYIGNLGE